MAPGSRHRHGQRLPAASYDGDRILGGYRFGYRSPWEWHHHRDGKGGAISVGGWVGRRWYGVLWYSTCLHGCIYSKIPHPKARIISPASSIIYLLAICHVVVQFIGWDSWRSNWTAMNGSLWWNIDVDFWYMRGLSRVEMTNACLWLIVVSCTNPVSKQPTFHGIGLVLLWCFFFSFVMVAFETSIICRWFWKSR